MKKWLRKQILLFHLKRQYKSVAGRRLTREEIEWIGNIIDTPAFMIDMKVDKWLK